MTFKITEFPDEILFTSTNSTVSLEEESLEWKLKKIGKRTVRVKLKSTLATYRYIDVMENHPTEPRRLLGTKVELNIDNISRSISFGLIKFKYKVSLSSNKHGPSKPLLLDGALFILAENKWGALRVLKKPLNKLT